MIVDPFAQSRAPKVETQHWQPEAIQRLRGVVHDLVVHRPAMHGMRMANQRSIGHAGLTGVQ